jgi:hypothetical protein
MKNLKYSKGTISMRYLKCAEKLFQEIESKTEIYKSVVKEPIKAATVVLKFEPTCQRSKYYNVVQNPIVEENECKTTKEEKIAAVEKCNNLYFKILGCVPNEIVIPEKSDEVKLYGLIERVRSVISKPKVINYLYNTQKKGVEIKKKMLKSLATKKDLEAKTSLFGLTSKKSKEKIKIKRKAVAQWYNSCINRLEEKSKMVTEFFSVVIKPVNTLEKKHYDKLNNCDKICMQLYSHCMLSLIGGVSGYNITANISNQHKRILKRLRIRYPTSVMKF